MFKKKTVQKIKKFLKGKGGATDIFNIYSFLKEKELVKTGVKPFEVVLALIEKGYVNFNILNQDVSLV